jgi:hypothetical protein
LHGPPSPSFFNVTTEANIANAVKTMIVNEIKSNKSHRGIFKSRNQNGVGFSL